MAPSENDGDGGAITSSRVGGMSCIEGERPLASIEREMRASMSESGSSAARLPSMPRRSGLKTASEPPDPF